MASFNVRTNLFFEKCPITQEILRKSLNFLPNKMNVSTDGLPKALLKQLSYELAYPMSIIFNKILELAYVLICGNYQLLYLFLKR